MNDEVLGGGDVVLAFLLQLGAQVLDAFQGKPVINRSWIVLVGNPAGDVLQDSEQPDGISIELVEDFEEQQDGVDLFVPRFDRPDDVELAFSGQGGRAGLGFDVRHRTDSEFVGGSTFHTISVKVQAGELGRQRFGEQPRAATPAAGHLYARVRLAAGQEFQPVAATAWTGQIGAHELNLTMSFHAATAFSELGVGSAGMGGCAQPRS